MSGWPSASSSQGALSREAGGGDDALFPDHAPPAPTAGSRRLVHLAHRCRADGLNLPWPQLDAGLVTQLREAGLTVAAGTANQASVVERLVRLGVDFVDSDRPWLAVAARDRATARSDEVAARYLGLGHP